MNIPESRETALLCVRFALEKKAYDLVVLDVAEFTSLGDYFVICTGRSDTQVQAIAQSVQEGLAKMGRKPSSVEGYSTGHWVLIDFADVIVHVFYEPVRAYYDLERLWGHAPRLPLPEPYKSLAQEFRLVAEANEQRG